MKKKQIDETLKYTRHERNEARRYADKLEKERDEARAAYEAETLSTLEMAKRITQLEAECHRAQCERDHWIEKARLSESKRSAGETADETSGRSAYNTLLDHP